MLSSSFLEGLEAANTPGPFIYWSKLRHWPKLKTSYGLYTISRQGLTLGSEYFQLLKAK